MIRSVDLLYSIAGFCVSLLVGMTGVGGGSLMTPLLVLLFGIHPATAVGTDLLYAAATKSAGTLVHGLNRNIDWRIVGRLAAGSVPMTALTLLALSGFGIYSGAARSLITAVLSGALGATAAALIFRKRILAFFAAHVGELSPRRTVALTVLLGAALGVLVSISSVGAGAHSCCSTNRTTASRQHQTARNIQRPLLQGQGVPRPAQGRPTARGVGNPIR